jgi:hypothetical protein
MVLFSIVRIRLQEETSWIQMICPLTKMRTRLLLDLSRLPWPLVCSHHPL